jgi:gas vesicle protein
MLTSIKHWRFIMSDEEGYGEEGYTVIGMDHYTSEEQNPYGRNIILFFIGGLVGAGLALLLAPQSGRKTRQKISAASKDARSSAESYYAQTRNKIEHAAEWSKDLIGDAKPVFNAAVEAGIAAYEREREIKINELKTK